MPPEPALAPSVVNNQLPNILELIKQGIHLYRERIKIILSMALLQALITVAVALVSFFGVTGSSLVLLKGGFNFISFGFLLLVAVVVIFAYVFFVTWFSLGMMHVLMDDSSMVGIKEALTRSRPQILSFLWVGILSGLVISAPFVGLGFIGLVGYMLLVKISTALAVILAGVCFCGIVGFTFLLSVRLFFANWVVVEGRARGKAALMESWRVTEYRFWPVTWRVAGYILCAVVLYALFLIVGALFPRAVSNILGQALSLFVFGPILLAVTLVLYRALLGK